MIIQLYSAGTEPFSFEDFNVNVYAEIAYNDTTDIYTYIITEGDFKKHQLFDVKIGDAIYFPQDKPYLITLITEFEKDGQTYAYDICFEKKLIEEKDFPKTKVDFEHDWFGEQWYNINKYYAQWHHAFFRSETISIRTTGFWQLDNFANDSFSH